MELHENCVSRLINNLRLNEIYVLNFSHFCFKINRNQLHIIIKATYGLHPNKYLEILHLTFWGRSLVTKRFGLHSNFLDMDEIKGLPISKDFCNRITELLLLFSIVSPWFNRVLNKPLINFFKANDKNNSGVVRLNQIMSKLPTFANIEAIFSISCWQIDQLLVNCYIIF